MPTITIPRRFHGPPRSGNGGWTAGALAETLPGRSLGQAITVVLKAPPPLDVPLALTETAAGVAASYDGRPVAEARFAEEDPEPVPPVPVREAAAAEASYAGLRRHPFPTCFTCGPRRRPDDGLRIFPGRVAGDPERGPHVAATWTPYEVSVPIVWAALDCPGGWASEIEERPAVLGTITVRIDRLPTTSDRYVVVGAVRGVEGRKTRTAATLYGPDGEVVASAEHVWIAVDPRSFS